MLKNLKWELNSLDYQLTELKLEQERHLLLLEKDLKKSILLDNLQDINSKYKYVAKWKAYGLSNGDK